MLRGASPSVRTFASLAMPTTSQRGIVFAPPHQPADGVSVGPAAPGHGLADDDHGLGVRAVGVFEVAPAEDLDAYHLEELRIDRGRVCDEGAVVCRRLEPVDVELGRARAERVQVQVADGADRLDAGERPEAIQQAPRVDARLVALALLTAERELDPDLWVLETKTMDRHLALMRLPQQLSAFVLSAFGVLALALAAVGLYGVVSYSVARRTGEITKIFPLRRDFLSASGGGVFQGAFGGYSDCEHRPFGS